MAFKTCEHTNLTVPDGGILDLSALVAPGPAGQYGRVIISSDGHFAFTDAPHTPVRFLCATNPFGPPGFSMTSRTDETIDAFAHQLRVHGYNMVRLHRIQETYMKNATADFDFDANEVDRMHYLLAALKAEGIYWTVDILSDDDGGYLNPAGHDTKLGCYYDTAEQNHWKSCADNFWDVTNPYTGLTTLADPALVFVTLVNEGGLGFVLRNEVAAPAGLEAKFVTWLLAKYGNTATMCSAWGDCTDDNLETGNVNMPINDDVATARQADMQHFFADLEGETITWMTDYLETTLGYDGLVSSLNNEFRQQNVAARVVLPIVDLHAYHDYAGGGIDGTHTHQRLTVTDAIYPRHLTGQRYLGRPFTATEHGALFWNRWRHQNGLMVGAYAAFQGFDMLCEHSTGSVELNYTDHLRRTEIWPFGVGMDPILRVGQTLEALLFLRGDVATSPSKVKADLSISYIFDPSRAGLGAIPIDVTKIGMVTGIGYYLSGTEPDYDYELTVGDLDADPTPWTTRIAQLKAAGILPTGNLTDEATDVFHSDTGQLKLITSSVNSLTVVTPKTEAAFFEAGLPLQLRRLNIVSASVPGMVSVSAMDGLPVSRSERLLLMIATDAQNTGMTFEEPGENNLVNLGTLPAMLSTISVTLRLTITDPAGFHLYALDLTGTQVEEIALQTCCGYVEAIIDTNALVNGPTTFFELVKP